MVDIEKLKTEIVDRLKPLNPDKIILFGSYAYGEPTEDSDIDIFLLKDVQKEKINILQVEAGVKLFDLIKKYKIGFDIFILPFLTPHLLKNIFFHTTFQVTPL